MDRTKHGIRKGHRLFCACDGDSVERYMTNGGTAADYIEEVCPVCGYWPWYYSDLANEPTKAAEAVQE